MQVHYYELLIMRHNAVCLHLIVRIACTKSVS